MLPKSESTDLSDISPACTKTGKRTPFCVLSIGRGSSGQPPPALTVFRDDARNPQPGITAALLAEDVIYSGLTFMHIKNKKAAMKKAFGLLLPGGRFVLSIGKSIDTILDYGTRKIRVYPDTPGYTDKMLIQSGFPDIRRYETESAYLFSALKAI